MHQKENFYISNSKFINYDYSKLIYPMVYILNKEEYLEYVNLDSLSKVSYIINYWSELNSNLFIEEFYTRTKYVNKKYYNGFNDGVKTDRGKIYILYGPPNTIERKIDGNSEYEIWLYQDNRKFIFLKRFGQFECFRC